MKSILQVVHNYLAPLQYNLDLTYYHFRSSQQDVLFYTHVVYQADINICFKYFQGNTSSLGCALDLSTTTIFSFIMFLSLFIILFRFLSKLLIISLDSEALQHTWTEVSIQKVCGWTCILLFFFKCNLFQSTFLHFL